MTFKSSGTALVAVGVLAVSLAACGSSSKGGSATGPSSTGATAAGASTTSVAAPSGSGTSASAPSGKPIEINMTIPVTGAYVFSEMKVAGEAAEKAINASGGIDGRPLKVDVCDTTSPTDPNPTETCVRQVIANQNVVAEVADYSSFNDIITPLENQAGLAQIGGIPLGLTQMDLPNSFPLVMPEEEAMGAALVTNGSKKPSLIYIDIPTAQKAYSQIDAFLKAAGSPYQLVAKQPAPLTATDLSPQVAALCQGSDGVAMTLSYTQIAAFLNAHRQGPCPHQLLVNTALGLANTTASLGAEANGMFVVNGLPLPTETSLEGIRMFVAQMNGIDPKAAKDQESLDAWASVWAFAQEARKMGGDVTRQSVLGYWSHLGNFQLFDLLPPGGIDFQQNAGQTIGDKRLFNHSIWMGVVKNEQIVGTGQGWVDVLKLGQ